jgi:hypothetical protein
MADARDEAFFARSGRGAAAAALQGRRNARATPGADFPLVDAPPWPFEDADPLTDRARRTLAEGSFYWRNRKNGKRREKENGGGGAWLVGATLIVIAGAAFVAWNSFPLWAP